MPSQMLRWWQMYTNLNKKRGEDALPAQRKRIDFILDKGNNLVKKCDSNRFWRYQSVDEEERSFSLRMNSRGSCTQ